MWRWEDLAGSCEGAPNSHPSGPDCRRSTENLKLGGRGGGAGRGEPEGAEKGGKVFTEIKVLGAAFRPPSAPALCVGRGALGLGRHTCPDPYSLLSVPWASCPDLPKLS